MEVSSKQCRLDDKVCVLLIGVRQSKCSGDYELLTRTFGNLVQVVVHTSYYVMSFSILRDTTKPGLWTMDWTVDWTMDWAFLHELSCSTTICFATWLERDL